MSARNIELIFGDEGEDLSSANGEDDVDGAQKDSEEKPAMGNGNGAGIARERRKVVIGSDGWWNEDEGKVHLGVLPLMHCFELCCVFWCVSLRFSP